MKGLYISSLLFVLTSAWANVPPEATTAEIRFSGRIVESSCTIAVGRPLTVRADRIPQRRVPINVTIANCGHGEPPDIRLLPPPSVDPILPRSSRSRPVFSADAVQWRHNACCRTPRRQSLTIWVDREKAFPSAEYGQSHFDIEVLYP